MGKCWCQERFETCKLAQVIKDVNVEDVESRLAIRNNTLPDSVATIKSRVLRNTRSVFFGRRKCVLAPEEQVGCPGNNPSVGRAVEHKLIY